ncbi:hypothetical protein M8T07_12610 [Enterobacter hormaechei]|nr:hypothetical protein [Enterobacter hormaechei]
MKIKVGAQKGAFIKMKQENNYIYQWLYGLCYVPIIAPSKSVVALHSRKSRSQIMAAGCTFSRHRFVPQRS